MSMAPESFEILVRHGAGYTRIKIFLEDDMRGTARDIPLLQYAAGILHKEAKLKEGDVVHMRVSDIIRQLIIKGAIK